MQKIDRKEDVSNVEGKKEERGKKIKSANNISFSFNPLT